jgi:sugar lactone lactonase YvrE
MKTPLLAVILFISVAVLNTGCKKSSSAANTPPSLTTNDVIINVTSTTAQSGGTISSIGSSAITENGVCYSASNATPTINDIKATAPIISTSYSFAANLTGLTPSTTYHVRAYATNAYGTSYGSVVTFATSSTLSGVSGLVSTFAGSGTAGFNDGIGATALFSNPAGMASDANGNIYVCDVFNNRIRKITPDGTVTTIAGDGNAGYTTQETPALQAEFYAPQGLAVDAQGNVFVADYGNNVIREIVAATNTVKTYAGNGYVGYVDGDALKTAEFNGPCALAIDANNIIYVADRNNNAIRKINTNGTTNTVAGTKAAGYFNTTQNAANLVYAYFRSPSGLALDANGNIYVADIGNSAIRKITSAGVVTTIAGGPGQSSLLGSPAALAMDKQGNFLIADESGRIIELTAANVLYDLAGAANVSGYAEGSGTAAKFSNPQGICITPSGNIFVSDFNNNRIRKVVIVTSGGTQ